MSDWKRVHWSEAGQVLAMLGKEATPEVARLGPAAHFAGLRASGELDDAVFFLALALPRYEAIVWGVRSVQSYYPPQLRESPDGQALNAALGWMQNPSDARRRAAHELATAPGSGVGAGVSMAMAVFMSGGSIVPESGPPMQPPPDLAGRFVGAAILAAVSDRPDRAAVLAKILDAGEELAREGLPT